MLHSFQQLNISILISLLISSTIPDNGTQFHIYTRKEHAGFIVNVEIQKQGYDFPGQRMSCYASDLLLRQYIKAKKMPDHSAHDFSYRDIKPVYVIVIFEHTTSELRFESHDYIHHGKTTFNTGLDLHMPERFCIIALDVFREIPYSEIKKCSQSAWLLLLSTEKLEDAERLVQDYPWMSPIFQEIAALRRRPKEVFDMWSEALLQMDENTLKYQVERMQAENEKLKSEKQIFEHSLSKSEAENKQLQARIAELEHLLQESQNK